MKNIYKMALAVTFLIFAFGALAQDKDDFGTPNIGERLFLDVRFSQFFFAQSGGNANYKLTNGDPVMDTTVSIYGSLPGTFAGQAMNCRACHFVEEHESVGNRTYADFATRSPIPANGDGRTVTPRNSIDLVNSLIPHNTPLFLHYDGQFTNVQDLIITTFTGRNFGWKPEQYATALLNMVHVIRTDDGTGALAQQYGGWSYADAFAGLEQIDPQYRILYPYRLYNVAITNPANINYVSDERIIKDIGALVESYLQTLVFSQDSNGLFNGSPYDVFLIKNGLPRAPAPNEPPLQYSRRLLQLIYNLADPQFVTDPADGHFNLHNQPFQFGPTELAGLKTFFAETSSSGSQSAIGNCITCHTPPAFTDFLFHNTGTAQEEYDAIHGTNSFMALSVPGQSARLANYDAFLPPTTNHPNALGTFINPPTLAQPGQVDLGLWNVFANPDFPAPQPALQQILPMLMHTPAPQIGRVISANGKLAFTASNGLPGRTAYVRTATNFSAPPGSWDVVSTNVFDSAGQFSFTNSNSPDSQRFYLVSVAAPSPELALPETIGMFKTPNVRDPASSEPYFHTGRMNTLEDVLAFYQNFSGLAAAGLVRNADPNLAGISFDNSAVAPLAAFLRSLNEDYVDIPCPCQ